MLKDFSDRDRDLDHPCTMLVIEDLNKADLLKALWMAQRMPGAPDECFIHHAMNIFYEHDEAKEALNGRIITLCHKNMEVDLRGSLANPYHYDRIAGKGTFERVIRKLRQKK